MPYDKSVVVPLSADDTFALITQPERLRRWNCIAARIDVRAGGDYRWTIVPGSSAAGTISEIEPGRRLVFGWGWEGYAELAPDASTVTITLEPTARRHGRAAGPRGAAARSRRRATPRAGTTTSTGWWSPARTATPVPTTGDHATLDELDELKSAEATLRDRRARPAARRRRHDLGNSTPCRSSPSPQVADHLTGSIVAMAARPRAPSSPRRRAAAPSSATSPTSPSRRSRRGRDAASTARSRSAPMELPAAFALGILSVEFLVHAWDFAVATGQKLTVDDTLRRTCSGCRSASSPTSCGCPAMFGPELDAGTDADSLDRLIAFTGRAAA